MQPHVAEDVVPSNAGPLSDWLDHHVWPQIQTMMFYDALFKLMARARELTGEFSGQIAGLIEIGYVTSQTLAIRRLCDARRDVISLRRSLVEAEARNLAPTDRIERLLGRLNSCDHVCRLVNDYVAHTANPLRRPNVGDWTLQVGHLTEAQKTVCEVAITFDRDLLHRKHPVEVVPVPQQGDLMQEFRLWVPTGAIKTLWDFWHAHRRTVNAWIL